jgi:hypothetical protein
VSPACGAAIDALTVEKANGYVTGGAELPSGLAAGCGETIV